MGAVADRSGVTLATLKLRLGVEDAAQDDVLSELLAAVFGDVEDYLNFDFTDDDGAELPIPSRVILGVYEVCIFDLGDTPEDSGLKAYKEGDVSWTYRDKETARAALMHKRFDRDRRNPGL